MQVPGYALFVRLKLSAEDQQAQNAVLHEAIEGLETLFAGAKETRISVDEHGLSNFSATFEPTEEDK